MRRASSLALVLALIVAACGGDDGRARPADRNRRAVPVGLSPDDPGCEFIVAGTEQRSTTPGDIVQYLTNAVVESSACYDRVRFIFDQGDAPDGVPPAYTVRYQDPPFSFPNSTSGLDGVQAVLVVRMQPTDTKDRRTPGREIDTYLGNLRLTIDQEAIENVEIVEWITPENLPPDITPNNPNDNFVIWLIGLDRRRPFTVDFSTTCAAATPTTGEEEATNCPHIDVLIMK